MRITLHEKCTKRIVCAKPSLTWNGEELFVVMMKNSKITMNVFFSS